MSPTLFATLPATSPQSTPSKKVRRVTHVMRRVELSSYYIRVALITLGCRCHKGTHVEDSH